MRLAAALKALLVLAAAATVLAVGYHNRGWGGFWLALGGVVFLLLLYLHRMLRVLRMAARAPQGWTSSAVMLHARLHQGMLLLDVVKLARAMGQPQAASGAAQEIYRWADPGGAWVQCHFENGRLGRWQLQRPAGQAEGASP